MQVKIKKPKVKIDHKTINFVIPLIALVVIIVVGVVWTIPTLQDLLASRVDREIVEKRLFQEVYPRKEALEQTDEKDLDEKLEILQEIVPESAEPAYLLATLNEIGDTEKLLLRRPTYSGTGTDNGDVTKTVTLQVELTDTMENAAKLLKRISEAAPALKLESFTITQDEESADLIYEFFIEISSPYSPLPETLENDDNTLITSVLDTELQVIEEVQKLDKYLVPISEFKSTDVPKGKKNLFTQ